MFLLYYILGMKIQTNENVGNVDNLAVKCQLKKNIGIQRCASVLTFI